MYQNCPKAVKPQKKIGTNWNFGVSQGFVPIFVPIPQEKSSPAAPFSPRLVKIQENPSGSLLTGQNTLKTGGEDGKSEFSSSRGGKNWIFLRQGEKNFGFSSRFPHSPSLLGPQNVPKSRYFCSFSQLLNKPASTAVASVSLAGNYPKNQNFGGFILAFSCHSCRPHGPK